MGFLGSIADILEGRKKRWTPLSQTLQGMDKKAQVLVWQYVDEIINCNHIGPFFLFSDKGGAAGGCGEKSTL